MSDHSCKAKFEQVIGSFRALLDAIPKGKYLKVLDDVTAVELFLRYGVAGLTLLDTLRRYFLEMTGEESPFVKQIDKLIPRD